MEAARSIKVRLWVGLAMIVLWTVAQAALSHVVISRQMAYNRRIANLDSQLTVLSHLLKTEVMQMIRFELDFLVNIEDPEARSQALKHFQEADLRFNEHLNHLILLTEKDPEVRPETLKAIKDIEGLNQSYSQGFFR